ncbi:MAG: STAS domain-containing protein [Candidatus Omnitrophica bacterium]|nr:STAS domain-containing protein [Candidatus Omnitrophota bacterium]MBU1128621.1 STAS domain-containing protein [Candidatus Omnitrophota bacterium]MBU1657159.1 STAS domain-containing protein [Candidatus Omnitrophota bacterium]MBU1784363.1 STAS domain-containing protein [Candidatus Omnitrophota bacterium]MBU1852166.1 STAS domain-containing protein [Candidatus Omnitrophota bacterium]
MQDLVRRTEGEAGAVILTLTLDSITVHQNKELMEFFSAILDDGVQKTILDLSNTSYVSSMVLSSLMFFHKKIRASGGDFVLCGVNSRIKEILATTKLDKVLIFFEDTKKAMAYFAKRSEVVPKTGKEAEMKLDVKGFALAGGILWGASVFLITWMKIIGYGSALDVIKSYYIGYSVTPLGSIIGAVYGFFDFGIACAIFALLYNKLAKQ